MEYYYTILTYTNKPAIRYAYAYGLSEITLERKVIIIIIIAKVKSCYNV